MVGLGGSSLQGSIETQEVARLGGDGQRRIVAAIDRASLCSQPFDGLQEHGTFGEVNGCQARGARRIRSGVGALQIVDPGDPQAQGVDLVRQSP